MSDLKAEDADSQLVDIAVEKRAPRIVKEIDVFLSPCGDGNTKVALCDELTIFTSNQVSVQSHANI